ncbi:uncharacterized protein K452DRAFT_293446 [Aplosporella prunicola CBS 121167]|uniref:Uncharacterized protein n=1 Tax=Aplosporella prunicola CBS 121167 TaxID=1176127 RepID=A0A6A6AVY8_9PEZI|nr:uncharacterized protein K452DRAFT_293446 [Aplosporella prunicola CBS 121167]KAF2135135.1 hypothetical protein K452DRAFT_293446 [Aplosporella prunicola CBS 121167]
MNGDDGWEAWRGDRTSRKCTKVFCGTLAIGLILSVKNPVVKLLPMHIFFIIVFTP